MKRAAYTEEFKMMLVEEFKQGKDLKEICENYNVNESMVRRWSRERNETDGKESSNKAELGRLQCENMRLKEEVKVLKQAVAIISEK